MLQESKAWWRHPDQDLLRREMAWTFRWLRRPGVLACLLAYSVVSLFVTCVRMPILTVSGLRGSLLYSAYSNLDFAVLFVVWVQLMHKRVFQWGHKETLQELQLTLLQSRMLWPGLLAAPVVLLGVFACIDFACELAGRIFFLPSTRIIFVFFWTGDSSVETLIRAIIHYAQPFVQFPAKLAAGAAVTCFVVLWAFPKAGFMGIVLRAIAGWGCVALPAFSLSELVYWTMDNSLFGATSHRAITVFGLLDSIVSPLVYFCVAFLFLSIFLRLLRSEKMWQKMQRFAEKE